MADAVHISSKGIQEYVTPMWLVKACEDRFGVSLILDLAASYENKRCHNYIGESEDALKSDWAKILRATHDQLIECEGHALPWRDVQVACWLNPPFRSAPQFMAMCAKFADEGMKIITLTLSSLGTGWYNTHVRPRVLSLVLLERITFDGCKDPYPKECMISLLGFGMRGIAWWNQGRGPKNVVSA